jgi:hypothetical protein
MSENEVSLGFEAGIPAAFPVHAKLSMGFTKRWGQRGAEVVGAIADEVGGIEALEARTAASEELDALLVRAAMAAADSSLQAKRRLLAKAVSPAFSDDAKINEAVLIVDALARIDAVHIRALDAIHRAELSAKASGETGPVARGAEKPLTEQVREVTERLPEAVLRRLESEGLVSGSLTWDGLGHISGLTSFGEKILEDLRSVENE